MIKSISLTNTATFIGATQTLDGLSQFNYFFGSNGTGKTTISRLIADETNLPQCSIRWEGNIPLEPLVYNQDFIEQNLNQNTHLKGVFTLGEGVELEGRITEVKNEIDFLNDKIQGLNNKLDSDGTEDSIGKRAELEQLEDLLKDICWIQKRKYDSDFQDAFAGVRGKALDFKNKVLQEDNSNDADLKTLGELKEKAQTIFGSTPIESSSISPINFNTLLRYEKEVILKKIVIGKDDVEIASMIKKLGNSDWVNEGRPYLELNEGFCPFCQQKVKESLNKDLCDYFDETYTEDIITINKLFNDYSTESERIKIQIESLLSNPSEYIDAEKMEAEKQIFDSKSAINFQRLSTKQKEASRVVELESLENVTTAISLLISNANKRISVHNETVRNLSTERTTLIKQVWRYILEELKADLESYKIKKDTLSRTISCMETGLKTKQDQLRLKKNELRELEKQTTSMIPTRDGINSLLNLFGFQGFKLEIVEDTNSYKLVRTDGSDAKNTLSEGERTFVTFLYFYHRLKGSMTESGITTNRIVVFDDPVSSLDSDILFIVSSLIKGLICEVRKNIGNIKQIFVLTHNVYFHKEVTFNPNRCDVAMNEETFWVVRKLDSVSFIDKYDSNPIKTSYDLLWSEIRRDDKSNLTIQNTLRRILENYFKILGGINPDDICGKFEGKDRLICKSLFSWVNDGSHFAMDDLYISIDDTQVEMYLNVFKAIFEKTEHIAHYNMMMGIG